jgi:hypothetical protein
VRGLGVRGAAALAAVVVAVVAATPAMSATARDLGGESEAARVSLAKADAEGLLSDVQLPEGAILESSDPSVGQGLPALPTSQPPARRDEIIEHRWWRVPGEPQEVLAWIEAHTPAGGSDDTSPGGGPRGFLTVFRFTPREPDAIAAESLRIDGRPAEGGGTALRLEGEVAWFPLRPASERIPAHVKLIRIVERQKDFTRRAHSFSAAKTVSRPAVVRHLIAAIEALGPPPPAAAEPHRRPDKPVSSTSFELQFRASPETEPLARLVVFSRSGGVLVSVGARKEPSLSESRSLQRLLEALLAGSAHTFLPVR